MAQNENQNIDHLYIAEKQTGERVTATEWNLLPEKINEIVDRLNGMPEETKQQISAALTTLNNVRPMSTAEYLALGSWDTRVWYVCIDDGELQSLNLGLCTIASRAGTPLIKGFPLTFPIIF